MSLTGPHVWILLGLGKLPSRLGTVLVSFGASLERHMSTFSRDLFGSSAGKNYATI